MRERMSLKAIGTGLLVGLYFEAPVRYAPLDALAVKLEASGRRIARRMRRGSSRQQSIEQARHVIGIERWGQRRLRVALGEPPTEDEYNGYRPPADADWDTLRSTWESTRRDTIALVRELAQRPIDDIRVRHNGLGPLSVRGWVRYLLTHAEHESWLIW